MSYKQWSKESEECMDKFLETGEPLHLQQFMTEFRCNAGPSCASCPANAILNNYHNQIGMAESTNQYGWSCAIVYCLNESLECNRSFRFMFFETIRAVESKIGLSWGGLKEAPFLTGVSKIMEQFDQAKFLFMFMPVWEYIKNGDQIDI